MRTAYPQILHVVGQSPAIERILQIRKLADNANSDVVLVLEPASKRLLATRTDVSIAEIGLLKREPCEDDGCDDDDPCDRGVCACAIPDVSRRRSPCQR